MPLSHATKATIQKELPSEIANIVTLPVEKLKHRLITENGLTVAQEEEILAAEDEGPIGEAMTPDEFLDYLSSLRNED